MQIIKLTLASTLHLPAKLVISISQPRRGSRPTHLDELLPPLFAGSDDGPHAVADRHGTNQGAATQEAPHAAHAGGEQGEQGSRSTSAARFVQDRSTPGLTAACVW